MEVDGHTHLLAVINFMTAAIIGKVAQRAPARSAPAEQVQSFESMATTREENNRKELYESFMKALDDNQGIIIKICRDYCNTRVDEEDLGQEIVYQLWKHYPSFQGGGKVSTWMHSVAMRTAIIPFRSKNPKVKIELREELSDQAAEDEPIQAEGNDRWVKLFYRLDNFDRAIVKFIYEGYNQNEIAVMLNLHEVTVRMRMTRIRKKIDEL